jgi:hypothetical protein
MHGALDLTGSHAAMRALAQTPQSKALPSPMTSRNKFLELRITQAHIRLLCLPENPPGARMISLERIGACEIRMFELARGDATDAPLFWMELFDHDEQSSLDSCNCYRIEAAAAAFEDFVSQAQRPAPEGHAPHD